jgi:hypothetical protein
MANSGIGSQLGLKKETTWGTAVTVDKFFKYESETFSLDPTTSTRSACRRGHGRAAVADEEDDPQGGRRFRVRSRTSRPATSSTRWSPARSRPSSTPRRSRTPARSTSASSCRPSPRRSRSTSRRPTAATTAYTYPGSVLTVREFSAWRPAASSWRSSRGSSKDETTPATTPAGAALATASYARAMTSGRTGHDAPTTAARSAASRASTGRGAADGRQPPLPGTSGRDREADPEQRRDGHGHLRASTTTTRSTRRSARARSRRWSSRSRADGRSRRRTSRRSRSPLGDPDPRHVSPTVGGPDLLDQSIPFVAKYDGTNAPMKVESTPTRQSPPGSEAVAEPSASRGSASSAATSSASSPRSRRNSARTSRPPLRRWRLTRPRTHLAGRARTRAASSRT